MAAGRTLIRRYALALTPAGVGNEAAVTATAVPPLSGGPGEHGSEATHAPHHSQQRRSRQSAR